jgi:hypothetical protein
LGFGVRGVIVLIVSESGAGGSAVDNAAASAKPRRSVGTTQTICGDGTRFAVILSLTIAERQALARAADQAVSDALDGSVTGWKTKAPGSEPDAVAAVVSAGMPLAAIGWSPTLLKHHYHVQIIGIFCHGTPYVKFDDAHGAPQPSCELADLLIVMDEGLAKPALDRRALLVQAKIAGHPSKRLSGSDLIQLDLYQRHPDFQFARGPYPRGTRNIRGKPGAVADGFSYGMIDLLPGIVGWEQMPPANLLIMGSGQTLGTVMADMAAGLAGRETIPGGSDDWSDTIEELLSTTFAAVASGSYGSPKRGVTTLAFLNKSAGAAGLGFISQPPDDEERERFEREPGPLSLVYVRLSPIEEEDGFREG